MKATFSTRSGWRPGRRKAHAKQIGCGVRLSSATQPHAGAAISRASIGCHSKFGGCAMTRVLLALGLSLGLGAFAFTAEPAHAQKAGKGEKVCKIKMKPS